MASIKISKPGTEFGPCETICIHTDCAQSRKDADANCILCSKKIGYERQFYREEEKYQHFACDFNPKN